MLAIKVKEDDGNERKLHYFSQEAMPADSGWYWCDTDSYQSVRYVDVKAMPPNAHDVQAVIKMTQDAEDDTLHVPSKRLEPVNVNIANVENQVNGASVLTRNDYGIMGYDLIR